MRSFSLAANATCASGFSLTADATCASSFPLTADATCASSFSLAAVATCASGSFPRRRRCLRERLYPCRQCRLRKRFIIVHRHWLVPCSRRRLHQRLLTCRQRRLRKRFIIVHRHNRCSRLRVRQVVHQLCCHNTRSFRVYQPTTAVGTPVYHADCLVDRDPHAYPWPPGTRVCALRRAARALLLPHVRLSSTCDPCLPAL